ncbi:hypothetical protein DFJ74DRAFT_672518 [Hyaloraphidium curvatum]|nr:hypothetical protein DFJ74DRAFT_672518 [Hyaloraphidium curvatum]
MDPVAHSAAPTETSRDSDMPPLPSRTSGSVLLLPTLCAPRFVPPDGSRIPAHARTFQISIHAPPRALLRELQPVFPSIPKPVLDSLCVVCVYQPTVQDLVAWDSDVNRERDLCLEYLHSLLARLATLADSSGVFLDFTDPPTGLPFHSPSGPALFPDVDSHHRLLRYPITQVGSCGVLVHPEWGTRCYPATAFVEVGGVDMLKEWVGRARTGAETVDMGRELVAMLEQDIERGIDVVAAQPAVVAV